MGLLPTWWSSGLTLQAYVFTYLILDTLITIAFFAVLMAACWRRVGATQFSLYMAIANMGLSGGAALLGPLQRWTGYSELLFVVAACSGIVAILLVFTNVARHQQRVTVLDATKASSAPVPVLS
jgi:PAT family beta-lactamase induction signal transducer AmpG